MKIEETIDRVLTQIILQKYPQIVRVVTEQVREFEIKIYFFVSDGILYRLKEEIWAETTSLLQMLGVYDDYAFTVGFRDYTTSE